MKPLIRTHIIGAFTAFCTIALPLMASAETVQWTTSIYGDYQVMTPHGMTHLLQHIYTPQIAVAYHGGAYQVDSSGNKIAPLASGATLSPGELVLFEFGTHTNEDIFWNATGGAHGTPNGFWISGAAWPQWSKCGASTANWKLVNNGPLVTVPAPLPADFYGNVEIIDYEVGSQGGAGALYAALSVNPPSQTANTSGNWAECHITPGVATICRVGDSGGSASGSLIYASTPGAFYGSMTYYWWDDLLTAAAHGDDYGCADGGKMMDITVPQQSIDYTFNTVPASSVQSNAQDAHPPKPVVNSGACVMGSQTTITMSSTDPNNDTIRYGVDWNADGTVDQRVPPSGFVSSGLQQQASRTFATEGAKTVNVIAYDRAGYSSPWGSVTINCADDASQTCSNGLDKTAYPSCTCPAGQVISGSQCVAGQCSGGQQAVNGICQCTGGQQLVSGTCACSGGQQLIDGICQCLAGQTLVNGTCQFPGQCTPGNYCQGSAVYYRSASCTSSLVQNCEYGCYGGVCLGPPQTNGTLTAIPSLVARGNTSQISWNATNVAADSCTVTGNGDLWTGTSGQQTSSPINASVTYTLACTGLDHNPFTKSVQISLLPVFKEK